MPQRLPFEATGIDRGPPRSGALPSARSTTSSPPELRAEAEQAPHLMAYLHKVPMGEFGVPVYYPQVSRKMGDIKDPNLIYPVGQQHLHPHLPGQRGRAKLLHRDRADGRPAGGVRRGHRVPAAGLRRAARRCDIAGAEDGGDPPRDRRQLRGDGPGERRERAAAALAAVGGGRGRLPEAAVRRRRRRREAAAASCG